MGALSAALLCYNLHQEIKVDDDTPFFITEMRKRICTSKLYRTRIVGILILDLVVCSYVNDKRVAISAGRPPTLTRSYCRLQVPVDLTDAQFMLDGPELETALCGLDQDGWNQCDIVQKCAFARHGAANALIAEEILEISLGHLATDEIIRRASEIEDKTIRCWNELPEFIRMGIEDPMTTRRPATEILFLMMIRLGHLEHRFLLQRTLSKIIGPKPADSHFKLLSVCEELFRFVLVLVENKDHIRDFQVDFVMLLAVHGVPTAAILAVELLQQEQNTTDPSNKYPLHRSEMIQSLSVFVSCLGTVRTEIYGAQSCERGRKFLKTVLDMILGPGAATARESPSQALMNDVNDPMFGAPLGQPGGDADFAKWLESMEWEQDVWVNFN